MSRNWIAVAVLSVVPALAWAQDPPGSQPGMGTGQGQGSPDDSAGNTGSKGSQQGFGSLTLPSGSKLLGEASSSEIRELPEITSTTNKESNPDIQRVVGVSAVDRLYSLRQPYKKTVSFFDSQLKKLNVEAEARVTTPVSTAWAVQLPEGGETHIIVRNTQPVSFEVIQATGEQGTMRQPTGGGSLGSPALQPPINPGNPGNNMPNNNLPAK